MGTASPCSRGGRGRGRLILAHPAGCLWTCLGLHTWPSSLSLEPRTPFFGTGTRAQTPRLECPYLSSEPRGKVFCHVANGKSALTKIQYILCIILDLMKK